VEGCDVGLAVGVEVELEVGLGGVFIVDEDALGRGAAVVAPGVGVCVVAGLAVLFPKGFPILLGGEGGGLLGGGDEERERLPIGLRLPEERDLLGML